MRRKAPSRQAQEQHDDDDLDIFQRSSNQAMDDTYRHDVGPNEVDTPPNLFANDTSANNRTNTTIIDGNLTSISTNTTSTGVPTRSPLRWTSMAPSYTPTTIPTASPTITRVPPSPKPTTVDSSTTAPSLVVRTLTPSAAIASAAPTKGDPWQSSSQMNSFTCSSSNASTISTPLMNSFVVRFDYDLYYQPSESNLTVVINYVEHTILQHLALSLGCLGSIRRSRKTYLRSLQQYLNQTNAHDDWAGGSAAPPDELDSSFRSCEDPGSTSSGETCVPVSGGMTIDVRAPSTAVENSTTNDMAVQLSLWSFVQTGMGQDWFVLPGVIERVAFVGNRTRLRTDRPAAIPLSTSAPATAVHSTPNLGIVVGSTGAAVLMLLAFLFIWRQRRERPTNVDLVRRSYKQAVEELAPLEHDVTDDAADQGSLADRDSLALEPQIFQKVYIPPTTPQTDVQTLTPLSTGSLWHDVILEEGSEDMTDEGSERMKLPSLGRFASYEARVIAEALHAHEAVASDHYDLADSITTVESDSMSHESDLTSTDQTPRTALQMT